MVAMSMPKENDELIIEIERILTEVREKTNADSQQLSIYRVPAHIRKNNEYYYEPRLVSIGPYHHNKEHLRAMEEKKVHHLNDFIGQNVNILHDCIREIRKLEADIRACYSESVGLEEGDQFVKMMVFDSCFIIQFFIKWRSDKLDASCNAGWVLPLLVGDLLMLENQIPFSVLTMIYNLFTFGSVDPPKDTHEDKQLSFTMLISESLHEMHKRNDEKCAKIPKHGVTIKHILHLFYLLFVPTPEYPIKPIQCNSQIKGKEPHTNYFSLVLQKCDPKGFFKSKKLNEKDRIPRVIPSAIELRDYGVKLKKKEEFKSFLDVTFKDGTLEVPCFMIEECSRSKYLNLIAFEQCGDLGVGTIEKPLSSYARFMTCLVNMPVDVLELEQAGILENNLANSVEGAQFFHQLRDCAHVNFGNHYLNQVFVEVFDHCQALWPKYRAELCNSYFRSPWTIFSLIGGLLILSLTVFRTICFILDTFHKKT
jgi:Plant protein of unknown function